MLEYTCKHSKSQMFSSLALKANCLHLTFLIFINILKQRQLEQFNTGMFCTPCSPVHFKGQKGHSLPQQMIQHRLEALVYRRNPAI